MRLVLSTAALLLAFPGIALAVCGDSVIDLGESCDDLNTTPGDGCDATCQVEPGWNCQPAAFTLDFDEVIYDDTYSPPSWSLSADQLTVTQSVNSDAAVYISTLPVTGVTLTFELSVNTSADNDYIGWVVGYELGMATSSTANWLLFDWKQGSQSYDGTIAYAGLAVSEVTGDVQTAGDLWGHQGNVSELARANTLGSTGWGDNTTHTVEMSYSTVAFEVWVDGNLEFSETGSFPSGNFGFYNYSQPNVEFTLVSPVDQSVCGELDTDGDGLTDPIELAIGTDPNLPDSDGDGILDPDEVGDISNPTNTDGDLLIDAIDPDDDGDGVNTADEAYAGNTDPTLEDTDGDLIPDYLDTDDDGDGVDTIDEECAPGDGDPTNDDADGDLTPNYLDLDSDDDGVSDADEALLGTDPCSEDTNGDDDDSAGDDDDSVADDDDSVADDDDSAADDDDSAADDDDSAADDDDSAADDDDSAGDDDDSAADDDDSAADDDDATGDDDDSAADDDDATGDDDYEDWGGNGAGCDCQSNVTSAPDRGGLLMFPLLLALRRKR